MFLKKNVLYHVKLAQPSFGTISTGRLITILSSGRMCGVLIESDIASKFDGVSEGTQGAGADLIDAVLGKIQAKTFRSSDFYGHYKSGKKNGTSKKLDKRIFTTKSGLWNSMKRRRQLGEDVDLQIVEYFDKYDNFCYIDISKMPTLEYSFVIISSEMPKKRHVNGNISYQDILDCISTEVHLE